MNERHLIFSLAKKEIEKRMQQAEKTVKKHSDKLANMDFHNTTVRSRANARINLDLACEERDRWKRRLEITEKWMEEIKV